VLTGGLRPADGVLKVIRAMPIPVLLTQEDSYQVASKVHDLNVKTPAQRRGKNLAHSRHRRQKCECEENCGDSVDANPNAS
jgi:hypothetical protein